MVAKKKLDKAKAKIKQPKPEDPLITARKVIKAAKEVQKKLAKSD